MTEYTNLADNNSFQFTHAVFSHVDSIHDSIRRLISEQLRDKLILFEGKAKESTMMSIIKW